MVWEIASLQGSQTFSNWVMLLKLHARVVCPYGHSVSLGDRVNTSVPSVDSSADCAAWAGPLGSLDQFEEPHLLGWEKPLTWTSQGLRAVEHQGFVRGEWDKPALGGDKARWVKDPRENVFDSICATNPAKA